jgi:UDP-glucose 4-epimerase
LEKKLRIFGEDWNTIDGSGVRDYIHVMDVADGHCKALDYLLSNSPQISFLNIGTGRGTSVIQLKNTFEKVNSCKIPFSFEKRRTGDVACIIADNKLSIKKLKWQPHRGIEDMCRDGWKYFCLNNNMNF